MDDEYVVNDTKSFGAYSTSRAKIVNNPLGAIVGGAAAWYITKKYTGIENTWAYVGIIVIGVIAGSYATSKIKTGFNTVIN